MCKCIFILFQQGVIILLGLDPRKNKNILVQENV